MSKIKVSLIEDTSETDVEENQESDKPMEPVLNDMQATPPPLDEKPKRIRKKLEQPPPPPPPEPEPKKQQVKGKMINCINCDKTNVRTDVQILPSVKMQTERKRRTSQKDRSKTRQFYCGFWLSKKNPTTCEIHSFIFKSHKKQLIQL